MTSFSIVITTYNRPEKVSELVSTLSTLKVYPFEIFVVDSSDNCNYKLTNRLDVNYIRSDHKNQPYQRYLGFSHAKNEYILFLDDDMEIVEINFLMKIAKILENNNAIGLALNFKDKHQDTTLSSIPKSTLFHKSKAIRRFKNWLTGYADLPQGTLGLCGNRGKQSSVLSPTQYVSGGAFLAKRSELFQNFNFQLFDLFEEKMGMGEDALIGYGLHKRGKLLFVPDIFFLHNDQKDSSYSMNVKDYAKRVLFSRLYLSLEKSRIDNKSLSIARIHYHWYACWRLLGLFINFSVKRSINSKFVLSGSWKGWNAARKFRFDSLKTRQEYWKNELKRNQTNGD